MKKFKIIPVLAVSMLLTACQTGIKVSKPKFAAEGSSMKLEDFAKEFLEGYDEDYNPIYGPAIKDSEFFQKDPKIGSKEMKGVDSASRVVTVTLDGKERSKSETKGIEEGVMQGDSTNKVIVGKVKTQEQLKEKTLYGTETGSSSEKREYTYQEGKGKMSGKADVEGLVLTDDITKEYELMTPFVEGNPITSENWYSYFVSQSAQQLVGNFLDAVPTTSDEKELAKYGYFKNDKIYTIKYASADDPVETKAIIDGEETVVRKTTTKIDAIYQLDVTEGKWALKTSVEITTTVEDLVDYSMYDLRKGLTQVTERKNYSETHLNDKKVSLKAKDLSKYVDLGE